MGLVCLLAWLQVSACLSAEPGATDSASNSVPNSPQGLDASKAELASKTADLEDLRAAIAAVRTNLNQAQDEYASLQAQLRVTEEYIASFTAKLVRLDAELLTQNTRLTELNAQQQTQQAALASQRAALAGQIRASHVIGRQEYLQVLLNQQNPARLGRSLIYYDYFNRARASQISLLASGLAELDQLEQTIGQQLAEVEQLRAAELQGRQNLEQGQALRADLLAELDADIEAQDAELRTLVDNEAQLAVLLENLEQAIVAAETVVTVPFASLRGKLAWPVDGPILVAFGSPRMKGAMTWHGVIIGADAGQQVQAIAAGRVAFADALRGFGLLMIIDHGEGFMSLYGHNQALHNTVGDWVETGAPIALVGSGEGNGRAGLYFEIRRQGEPENPARWCKRAG